MSNPSLPPAPAPPMGGVATSSPPLRRARDPDDDDDDDALEEGELRVLVPVPGGPQHESSDYDDTEDDDDGRRSRYLFQPRVEYDYDPEVVVRRPQHRSPPHRRPLNDLEILLLGPGAGGALPSPTPSGECESDATLSDDDHRGGGNPTGSSSRAGPSSAAADAVDWGWAATGKRGWKAGGNKNKKPAAVVLSDSDSDLNTVSAGDGQAGTSGTSAEAAFHHQQQPPLPEQAAAAQTPRAPQPTPAPPRRARERATEYTCKECGKSYTTNQALGGHAAGHKNKQREAAAMAAAMAAAAAAGDGDGSGGASLAASFPPLRRGGGGKAHECRMCGKVFATGVALGGHMRVHYTGPPIVPTRKNKKRCLAPPPPPKAERDIAVAAPPAVGPSLALSIKTEEESPSTPPAAPAAGAVRVVRLFGIDISPEQVQAPAAPLEQQQQQGSGGTTTEDSSATGQQQH